MKGILKGIKNIILSLLLLKYVFGFLLLLFILALWGGNGKMALFIAIFGVLLIAFSIILLVRKKKKKDEPVKLSKEFRDKFPIVIQYTPPKGINSAEAGLLYNCKVEPKDLTSLMYQWAYDGFIEIHDGSDTENMSKIILKKIKDLPENRPFFERDMFDSIFIGGKETKVISSSSQLRYALFLEDLQIHGVNKGWFEKKKIPKFVKILYGLLIGSGIVFLFVNFEIFSVLFLLFIIMSGYIYGYEKIQLTDKGAELVSYLIGYRNFIKDCDEKIINKLLEDDPLFLDKSLPYATAFGLETQFMHKTTPLLKDWNAKYLCGKKVSPLSGIIDGISTVESIFGLFNIFNVFKWMKLVKFLNKF